MPDSQNTTPAPIEFAQSDELLRELGGRFACFVCVGMLPAPQGPQQQQVCFIKGDALQALGMLQIMHARITRATLMSGDE